MKKISVALILLISLMNAAAQNVGIGTLNPTRAKFEVHGVDGVGATTAIFGGEGLGISMQRNWPTIGFNQYHDGVGRYLSNGYAAAQYLNPNDGGLFFDLYGVGIGNAMVTNTVRGLSLSRTGKVTVGIQGGTGRFGINSGNPTYTLEVVQTGGKGLALIEPTESYNYWAFATEDYGPSTNESMMTLRYGNTSSQSIMGYFRPTDGAYTQYSDSRLKTGVQKLPGIMKLFMKLNPVTYRPLHNNDQGETTYGFIAQEVDQLFPYLVSKVPNKEASGTTTLHALNYSGFGVLAVKAIQEQQVVIEKQQERIDLLEEKLKVLEMKLKSD